MRRELVLSPPTNQHSWAQALEHASILGSVQAHHLSNAVFTEESAEHAPSHPAPTALPLGVRGEDQLLEDPNAGDPLGGEHSLPQTVEVTSGIDFSAGASQKVVNFWIGQVEMDGCMGGDLVDATHNRDLLALFLVIS